MAGHNLKKLYLDICTLCRPFDDQSQMRIHLETNAYYLILQALQNRRYTLVVSPVHFEEANAISDVEERQEILAVLERLGTRAERDVAAARARAETLHARKFGVPMPRMSRLLRQQRTSSSRVMIAW